MIKLVLIACCFDGLNGILCDFFFFFFWLTFFKGAVLLKISCNDFHCVHQALDWVDGGGFERFAKVIEVGEVGGFFNSNRHIF